MSALFYGAVISPVTPTEYKALPHALLAVSQTTGDIEWVEEDVQPSALQEALARRGLAGEVDLLELKTGEFLMPGLIDTHTHAPQLPNMGSGQQYELLEWLTKVTFPMEARFADTEFAKKAYDSVVKRIVDCGTTTCCYYGSLHLKSTQILADIVHAAGQRAFVGKCNMNRESIPEYVEASTAASLSDTAALITHIRALAPAAPHRTRLVHPVLTPRFAISCTPDLLGALGEMAKADPALAIQTHIAENKGEVARTKELFPVEELPLPPDPLPVPEWLREGHGYKLHHGHGHKDKEGHERKDSRELKEGHGHKTGRAHEEGHGHKERHGHKDREGHGHKEEHKHEQGILGRGTYAGVYDAYGLFRENTILAHCVHLDDEEIELVRARGAGVSHCPTSNFNLRSGCARVGVMLDRGVKVGLGTDVSGGFVPSILRTIQDASICAKVVAFSQPSRHHHHDHDDARHEHAHKHDRASNPTDPSAPAVNPGFANQQLRIATLLYLATLGGASVCNLSAHIGSLAPGKAFDALLVSVRSDAGNPAIWGADMDGALGVGGKTEKEALEGLLERFLFDGDDRNIRRVYVQGRVIGGKEVRSSLQ